MRMTQKCLEAKVRTVNGMLGFGDDAGYATEGLVVLDSAYGGTAVYRYSGGHGGVYDLMGGHLTKADAGRFLDGMITALRIVQDGQR